MSNNPMQIHETIIRDIVDVATGLSAEGEPLKGIFNKQSYSSIAKGASNLTLVFPVISEESVGIDPARMCCKSIERKAVVMLQMLFSALCISDSKNAIDHIKNFHTNIEIDDELDIGEFISVMDKMTMDESSGIDVVDPTTYKRVKEDMKNINFHLDEGFNAPLNRFTIDPSMEDIPIREADYAGALNTVGRTVKDASDFYANQQIATDIKKANELVPTLMVIKFFSTTTDGQSIPTTAVIGVKAKLQYVSRQDMIDRIVVKNKDKNGLFNFLRASTREISFWKDFVFAIDRAKLDALSSTGRGSSNKIWKLLERRAIKSRIKRFTGMMNDASSITTLLISKETSDSLVKEYQIDPLRPRMIMPIMEAYNLMAIAVVDDVNEKVSFLFDDGSGEYEVISYAHLEREESGNSKKIINLLAKAR